MSELLAPAGDYESLVAAISNGADAIYLGLETLSARAYAKNFSFVELKKAVEYAHLRNVKVYVTVNTIVYEKELTEAFNAIKECYKANVDALIIQDLALIKHVIDNYKDMEAHISTQVGIDDIYGIRLLEKLGAKRIVVSRECNIEKIREFKKQTKVSIEAFIHGALCVSFSGGCLMSGLIGMRSGNRGRCVGPCRKKYKLFMDDKFISDSYILSMKDLNTSSFIKELSIIDSLKIEGRMKNPEYVSGVVNLYRNLLDNKKPDAYLEKTFNRTFTKGYLFNEDKKDIVNSNKPNNFGYLIGKIVEKKNNTYKIKLNSPLNQNDQIRIEAKEEINLPIVKLYDKNHNLIKSANDYCYIEMKEKANI
nr:U32 family peptidase [bacterium]